MDELKAISNFVRAVEYGSFNKAAEAQNTTPQAVSKAIRQLERHLGVRLFHRTTRKNSLTPEGERFFASVKPSLEGVIDAVTQARSAVREDEGIIRISAAGTVGRKVLAPLLAEYQHLHPLIQIDLLLEDRFTDIVQERIDVGFRSGNPPEAQVIARRLFPIQQIACASPEYLRLNGIPREPHDLLKHRCTGYRQPGNGRPMPWEFDISGTSVFQSLPVIMSTNDPEVEMLSVISGTGIGLIDSINAHAPICQGCLVPVLTSLVSERMGLYLYYGHRADMPARVRHFIDFATRKLLGSRDFLFSKDELIQYSNSLYVLD